MIKRIINIGLSENSNFREKRVIQLTNISSIILGVALISLSILHFLSDSILNSILLFTTGFVLLMNVLFIKIKYVAVAKIILVFSIYLVSPVHLILFGKIPEGQYLSLHVTSFLLLILGIIIFDQRQEPFLFYFSILFSLLWASFGQSIFYYFSEIKPDISYLQDNYIYYKAPPIIGSVILGVCVVFFKNIIYKYEVLNEKVRKEFEKKNSQLSNQNASLEEHVQEHTRILEEKTRKIYNLANITSQKIRKPLSTILDLTNGLRKKNDPDYLNEVIPELQKKCTDMDEVIREMAMALGDADQKEENDSINIQPS